MNKLPLRIIAYTTGIVSNGTFAYLMYESTVLGRTVILNRGTAPYGEQWIEIPLAIFGLIFLFMMMIWEVWNYE